MSASNLYTVRHRGIRQRVHGVQGVFCPLSQWVVHDAVKVIGPIDCEVVLLKLGGIVRVDVIVVDSDVVVSVWSLVCVVEADDVTYLVDDEASLPRTLCCEIDWLASVPI